MDSVAAASRKRTSGGAGDPQLITETKFMQQYRVGAPVHAGGQVVAVRNASGQTEIFSVATDGTVWSFYPDSASDTGYSGVTTGLTAQFIAAEVDGNGRIVVFGSSNQSLYYITETGQASGPRFGPPQLAQLPLPSSPLAIAGLYAELIGGALYVGVLTQFVSAGQKLFSMAYCDWAVSPGVFTAANFTVSSLNCVWSGSSVSTAEFTCLDVTYIGYNISSQSVVHYPTSSTFSAKSVATAVDNAGNNQYFSVLNDGNLYQLIRNSANIYSWAQITQGRAFLSVGAEFDGSGACQLFAVGSDANLSHVAQLPTGVWSQPLPIQSGVALAVTAVNDGADIDVFAVGVSQATLWHLMQNQTTTNWEITRIETPTNGQVEEFVSYSTDLLVTDAQGAPLANAAVQVWASAETRIEVNGAIYTIDPKTPANLVTNGGGRITATQQTGSLGTASLFFNVTNFMSPGGSIGVRQFAGVQDRLDKVNSQDLMTATKGDGGGYLLADQYRTQETTQALAAACNQCMALTQSTQVALDNGRLKGKARKLGVGQLPTSDGEHMNRLVAPAGGSHWQLDFSSGAAVFRTLSADEAAALIAVKRASHLSSAGLFDFLTDIGDFIVGIGEAVINVIDTVVTTVGNAVKAVITFVIDGVTYLFESVVSLIEQAFDLVETIFAKVKVFFEDVFKWLGFLFSWKDILRTHDALSYTVNQYLNFVQGAASGIQSFIDSGFATAQGEIDAIFDQFVASIGATSSVGGYAKNNERSEPAFDSGSANNIVFNAVMDNPGAAQQSFARSLAADDGGAWATITTNLAQLYQTVSDSPAFAQAITYMDNLGGSLDNIFAQLLSALVRVVQGVIKAVLSGVQTVIDTVLQISSSIVAGVQQILNEEWDIPLVSDLYAWLTGSKLTTLDLMCLMIAIPATVIYKAIKDEAPFPDAASVAAFETSFSSATILANFNPATTPRQAFAPAQAESGLSGIQLLLAVASLLCTLVFGGLTAIMDLKPMTGAGKPDPIVKPFSIIALTCEILAQAFGCPWIYSSGKPDCSTADGAGKTLWIFECLGVVLDCGFVFYESAFPENDDTYKGIIAAQLYGAGHIITLATVGDKLSGLALGSKICLVIPENTKFLRLPQIESFTEGGSLVALAALDVLGQWIAAGLGFADTISSSEDADVRAKTIPGAIPLVA